MTLISIATASAEFSVTTDFPGGNAIVESAGEDSVRIAPDQRDNAKPWFYWNFAVKGAAGKTIHFKLDPKWIGVKGPAVSADGGKTWKWLGKDVVEEDGFSHSFGPQDQDVRFSVGMPYVGESLKRFVDAHGQDAFLRQKVLIKSRKGRDVPLIELTNPSRKAPYAVAITARNHCCEMMGSYLLEGIMEGILADDAQGKWLRDNVDFFIVPFADNDGVEDGDQGKNRAPHDHNRDYGDETIYSEVAAIKEQLPAWSAGRPLVFFDLHDPYLKGDVHETLQFLASPNPDHAESLTRFKELVERDSQGTIGLQNSRIMKRGTGYNNIKDSGGKFPHASGWAGTLPNAILAGTVELAYANAGGYEVNADSARELGRDMAWGLQAYLKELQEKKAP